MEYFELAFVPFLYLSLAVCLVFYIHAYYSKAYNVGNMQSPLIIMASLSCTTLLVNALNNTFSSKIVKSILPILFYTFIYSATRLQISFFGRISVLSTTLTKRQTEIASNFLLFCLVCVNISAILVDIDLFVSGGVDTGRAAYFVIPQFLFLGTALLIESPLTAYCFFLIDRFSRKKKQTALKSDALNALRYSSLYSVVTDWTAAALLIFSFVFKSRYSENISNISGMFLHYHCLAYVIQFHFVLLGAFGKSAIVKTQSSKRNANASQKRERIPSIPTPAPFQRNNISAQMQRNNTQDMDLEAAPTQDAKDVATAPMQETRNIHDISTQEIQTQAAPTQNIHDISTEKMQSQAAAPTDIVVRSGTNQSNPGKSDPIL